MPPQGATHIVTPTGLLCLKLKTFHVTHKVTCQVSCRDFKNTFLGDNLNKPVISRGEVRIHAQREKIEPGPILTLVAWCVVCCVRCGQYRCYKGIFTSWFASLLTSHPAWTEPKGLATRTRTTTASEAQAALLCKQGRLSASAITP